MSKTHRNCILVAPNVLFDFTRSAQGPLQTRLGPPQKCSMTKDVSLCLLHVFVGNGSTAGTFFAQFLCIMRVTPSVFGLAKPWYCCYAHWLRQKSQTPIKLENYGFSASRSLPNRTSLALQKVFRGVSRLFGGCSGVH